MATHPPPISQAKLKAVRLLLNKKRRSEAGSCLIEGRRFVSEALGRPGTVEALLLTREAASSAGGAALLGDAGRVGIPAWSLTEEQMVELSDTVASQGVLAVVRVPRSAPGEILRSAGPSATLVALDGVSDPGNVGTIIRTCAWFGAAGLYLSGGTVELSNPKLLRSTMGAVFALPVETGVDLPELIATAKRGGYRVLAAEAGGEAARVALRGGGRRLLVFGSEAHGLSAGVRDLADGIFGIPGSGAVESLNVSVAVGVSLEIATALRG